MAMIKCKMCGGDLQLIEGENICECEYCGSRQTVPTADNEKKLTLFDRANRLRMKCEFDKAASVYENIVAEFPEEAEAYWGLCLCKYGIEYVDDPGTAKKVPTCHRTSLDGIFKDENFELAQEYADGIARNMYREEAKEIDRLQKAILEIAQKEEPFDIFICYKETDENGNRTKDSVRAQEIYNELTKEGYKVFFSRITLEDKLGEAYEPYIFSALSSAKIMLAIGTKYDYYNAVWVKNEWSRFLGMMKKDSDKKLIPCYEDIDAYDMPEEFVNLQGQDMGKLGYLQDLVRGINKILGKNNKPINNDYKGIVSVESAALVQRGNMALEDGDFKVAESFFERALDVNPSEARAYLGKFLVHYKVASIDDLKDKVCNLDNEKEYKRAEQFADPELAKELKSFREAYEMKLLKGRFIKVIKSIAAKKALEESTQLKERLLMETEEAKKKKQEEINKLQEQLQAGSFELSDDEKKEQERLNTLAKTASDAVQMAETDYAECNDMRENARLEELISSKKTQLSSLGIFKGKEKKELQAQINLLMNNLEETKKKLLEKQSEISVLKKQAMEVEKRAIGYEEKIISAKKKNIQDQIAKIQISIRLLSLKVGSIGDTVEFGKYEQGVGTKPIEWLVLDNQDNSLLLISKYALDCQKYNSSNNDITWASSTLRVWLNRTFLNNAFSSNEQSMIKTKNVSAEKNPKYSTNPGNDTQDKIFILSAAEAERYFSKDSLIKRCTPTAYAIDQNAYVVNGRCRYWLRSPGKRRDFADCIFTDGNIDYGGTYVNNNSFAVRPAIWINTDFN